MTNQHITPRSRMIRDAQNLAARTGGICAVIFIFLTILVWPGFTKAWDLSITQSIVAHRNAFFNAIAPAVSSLGGTKVVIVLAVIALALFVIKKKWLQAEILFGALLGDVIIVTAFKRMVSRLRPDKSFWLGTVEDQQSFPSGHSANNTVLWLTVAILVTTLAKKEVQRTWAKVFTIVAVLMPLCIGLSRIYVGQHWATDVLAGWSLGLTWTAFVAWVYFGQLAKISTRAIHSVRITQSRSSHSSQSHEERN